MRWVLIRPLNRSPYYDPEIQEPLGLEYLAAFLRRRRDEVLILDCALDASSNRQLARRAVSYRPDAIGFSITTAQELGSVREIHVECVEGLSGRKVRWLAGGNLVSTEPGQGMRGLPPDFHFVQFEGENALEELRLLWLQPRPPRPPRLLQGRAVRDLDALPFPERPFARQILGSGWAFNIQGSRGCCGRCHYCSSPGMVPGSVPRWRGRSPAHIADEVLALFERHGARSFNFIDEDFLGPPRLARSRARDFARELAARNLAVSFSIQVRPGTLNEEIIDTLVQTGLAYVFMGLESDDPADFRRWNRPYITDPWKIIAALRRRGVKLNCGVMLFHSHASLAGIRRFASLLRRFRLLDFRTAINRLDAMPGSKFYRDAMLNGTLDPALPGPQPLPYVDPRVKPLYDGLLVALEPLGPPSMHALCASPPLQAQRRFSGRVGSRVTALQRISRTLDTAVAETLFSLLDAHERKAAAAGLVSRLRRRNLRVAIAGARELAAAGFARSFAELREAIRTDSGL